MAKNASMFVKMAAIVSIVLMLVVFTESRSTIVRGLKETNAIVSCNQVTGVESGDDCTSISESFKLTLQSFLAINPNINCNSMFVDQWVCVDGNVTI
ncbi:hypothetical protein Lser_V15G16574 [Lactuca serriola]